MHPAINDFLMQGRLDRAEQLIRTELERDPEDAHLLTALAWCLVRTQRPAVAAQVVNHALQLDPNHAWAHMIKGETVVYDPASYRIPRKFLESDEGLRRRVARSAEHHYREALRLEPQNPYYHAALADNLFDSGRFDQARQAAEAGLAIDPQHVKCLNLLVNILMERGGVRPAEQAALAALAARPDDAYTHANRGWVLLRAGKHGEAYDHFRESLRQYPQSPWAKAGLTEAIKHRFVPYRMIAGGLGWLSKQDRNNVRHVLTIIAVVTLGLTVVALASWAWRAWEHRWASGDYRGDPMTMTISLMCIFVMPLMLFGGMLPALARVGRKLAGATLFFSRDGRLVLEPKHWADGWLVSIGVLWGVAVVFSFDRPWLLIGALCAAPSLVLLAALLGYGAKRFKRSDWLYGVGAAAAGWAAFGLAILRIGVLPPILLLVLVIIFISLYWEPLRSRD